MGKKRKLAVVSLCLVLGLVLALPAVSSEPALQTDLEDDVVMETVAGPPECEGSWRAVRLHCKQEFRGTAVGIYGGVGFSISCDQNRTTDTICSTGGQSWQVRMGVDDGGVALDCFFSGDSPGINESCAAVQLTVH